MISYYLSSKINVLWPIVGPNPDSSICRVALNEILSSQINVFLPILGPKPRHFRMQGAHNELLPCKMCSGLSWVLNPETSLRRVAYNELLSSQINMFWPIVGSRTRHFLMQGGPAHITILSSLINVFWPVLGPKPRHLPERDGPHYITAHVFSRMHKKQHMLEHHVSNNLIQ